MLCYVYIWIFLLAVFCCYVFILFSSLFQRILRLNDFIFIINYFLNSGFVRCNYIYLIDFIETLRKKKNSKNLGLYHEKVLKNRRGMNIFDKLLYIKGAQGEARGLFAAL